MERAVQPFRLAQLTSIIYQAVSRMGNSRFPSGFLTAILQEGGGGGGGGGGVSQILLCLKEGMHCFFFTWPLCMRIT